MAEEGDRGINFSSGTPSSSFVPVAPAKVGDQVTLYNLSGGDRLAVPAMNFALNDYVWVTPDFDFAGFDFKIDFDFLLIPFVLGGTVYTIHELTDVFIIDGITELWEPYSLVDKYIYMVTGLNAGSFYQILYNDDVGLFINRVIPQDNTESNYGTTPPYNHRSTVTWNEGFQIVDLPYSGPTWEMPHGNNQERLDPFRSSAFAYWGEILHAQYGASYSFWAKCTTENGAPIVSSPQIGQGTPGNWGWYLNYPNDQNITFYGDGEWHQYTIWAFLTGPVGFYLTAPWYDGAEYLIDPVSPYIGSNDHAKYSCSATIQIGNYVRLSWVSYTEMGFDVGDRFMIVDAVPLP